MATVSNKVLFHVLNAFFRQDPELSTPATLEFALFYAGVELSGNNYARAVVDNSAASVFSMTEPDFSPLTDRSILGTHTPIAFPVFSAPMAYDQVRVFGDLGGGPGANLILTGDVFAEKTADTVTIEPGQFTISLRNG